jgi:2-(1,2-epoxy-1,2-dihydrophenyl)acetyl-CoA isomerase
MNYNTLIVGLEDTIARITLNRPDRLNALNLEMYQELDRALSEIQSDPRCKVVVITGAGRAFCAGGDIPELLEAGRSIEATQKRLQRSHGIMARLHMMRQPIITAINGDAIGGGCSIALMGDLRVASEKARFGATFIRMGLMPDMGCIYNMVQLAGVGKAAELALLGDIFDAREAYRLGLLNRVVAENDFETLVGEWAQRLADAPLLPLQLLKPALHKALHMSFVPELESEIHMQSLCLNSNDAREAFAAFLEKRKPRFGMIQ